MKGRTGGGCGWGGGEGGKGVEGESDEEENRSLIPSGVEGGRGRE